MLAVRSHGDSAKGRVVFEYFVVVEIAGRLPACGKPNHMLAWLTHLRQKYKDSVPLQAHSSVKPRSWQVRSDGVAALILVTGMLSKG